jgi:hypothetical protein
MSPGLARDGSKQAVEAFEMRESLMRKFEAAGRKKPVDSAAG